MSINQINGLKLMHTRVEERGGAAQQARMIKDKRRSLNDAIKYSYQGAKIRRLEENEIAPALINPNAIKQDYDEKILSVGFEYNYQPGDIFEWVNTGTKWLIYLQELTEHAYFRGNIRKCSYEISWEDAEGVVQTTYAAVRGPQETSLESIQKFGFSTDLPNYKLYLMLPNRENVFKQFQRYSKFYLKGFGNSNDTICWRVEATDSISNPGIIEVYATEYYSNLDEDDIVNGIVGGLIPEQTDQESDIVGEGFIKPKKTYIYHYEGSEMASWIFDTTIPIETKIENNQIEIKWLQNYSGQFVLKYGSAEKTIVVESLF